MTKEDKAQKILELIKLAESIGWRSLAIARNDDEVDITGVLIGDDEFIDGFKVEMEKSLKDSVAEAFFDTLLDDSPDSNDDDNDGNSGGGQTFH